MSKRFGDVAIVSSVAHHSHPTQGDDVGDHLIRTGSTGADGADVHGRFASGDDPITGTDDGETLEGDDGSNVINGLGGDDRLFGFGGDDVLTGGSGADYLDGGDGIDTASYATSVGGIEVDLASGAGFAGDSDGDRLISIENVTGSASADSIRGAANVNVFRGGAGADILEALGGGDFLYGEAGDDFLAGGIGADHLDGGDGIDTASYDSSAAGVSVNLSIGSSTGGDAAGDTVVGVENLLGSAFDDRLSGGLGANRLEGGLGDDTLNGLSGADDMRGGAGNDAYVVDNMDDFILEDFLAGDDRVYSNVSYGLTANIERLYLAGAAAIDGVGNDLANLIVGNAGANVIDGAGGADDMRGGGGDDIYYVDAAGDTTLEAAGAGVDSVYSSVSHTLAANVERLYLTGQQNINSVGNALANLIVGNAGANVIDGAGGADDMRGGGGGDRYYVDDVGDTITEASGEGFDSVYSTISQTLGEAVEYLILTGSSAINGTGNSDDNRLTGNAAANVLDGGGGLDVLSGGGGDDTYIVDGISDTVVEEASAGTDTVLALRSYTLPENVENLILDGSHGYSLSGFGNGLDNLIIGNAFGNRIDGGGGVDDMRGGGGDDTYVVDSTADRITEAQAGGDGDMVIASVNYQIGLTVESLTLSGESDINATGNSRANVLIGNIGDNVLNGAGGVDDMRGGAGDDTYVIDNVADKITETAAGGTADGVRSSISYHLIFNVENLTLTGSAAIDGAGTSVANVIVGNSGDNVLNGTGGRDSLTGGAGADTFAFTTPIVTNGSIENNVDVVTDFSIVDDAIRLENAIFTGLAAGALSPDAFVVAAAAADASDRIIYNQATGALLFDSDGTGSVAAVQFATLTAGLALTAAEFQVV